MKFLLIPSISLAYLLACAPPSPPGSVELGQVTVREGIVSPEFLAEHLGGLKPGFEACYVEALGRDRTTAGQMDVALEAAGSEVTARIVSSGVADDSLTRCVEGVMETLTIPEPAAPLEFEVAWSLVFATVGAAPVTS